MPAVLLDHELGHPHLTAAELAPPTVRPATVTEPHACAGRELLPLDALPEPMFHPCGQCPAAWLPHHRAPAGTYACPVTAV